jgi:dihydroflavonol-4-reductase
MDAQPRSFDLVVINPFLVIGPELSGGVNTSNQILVDLTKGTYPGIMSLAWGFVDVRDVSRAHISALEHPDAHGRYVCAGEVVTMREVVSLMREELPAGVRLPTRGLDNGLGSTLARIASRFQPNGVGSYLRTHIGRVPRYDTSKIRTELEMEFRPARESLRDAVAYLVADSHISASGK